MGGNEFIFKQFTLKQDQCAMKVGTDGVLIGAWCPVENINSILDIGTGSGLISIMLAQRTNAQITAIDIDADCCAQAVGNISATKWETRLSVECTSLQDYTKKHTCGYDLIVSNPPYFVDSLQTPDHKRNTARHAATLTHEELIHCSTRLLNPSGLLCLILPVTEATNIIVEALASGLHLAKLCKVYSSPSKEIRRMLCFELTDKEIQYSTQTLVIHSENGEYTDDYKALTRDFYLKF